MRFSNFAAAASLAAAASGQKIRVMLLGDSITKITCWRSMVWSQLVAAGLTGSVQFVGSMTGLESNCQRPAGFDPHHEGHSGYQAYDIARNDIDSWVQAAKPDIVQFMLGTNDVNTGHRNVSSILDSYTLMLNAMRGTNPDVRVIVDKVIPTSWSNPTIESLDSAIPGWAQQYTTSKSPIVVADCSRAAGFTNSMLRPDGVHPNDLGDQFIAKQIGPKLIQVIGEAKAGQH